MPYKLVDNILLNCFQVYRNTESVTIAEQLPVGSDYFFRLVFNGKDMTNSIHFCKNSGISPLSTPRKLSSGVYLCPIESIIRFLHDDYFTVFNATNMKDACTIH